MLGFFNGLREMTMLSVTLRMLLAALCGGIIGLEREYKRRPAGFRTHILICLGAAMTTMTSQFLYLCMGYYTDMTRLGAQVIAGIGFIGAGTIIVTKHQRVKGLTTAAGLWACAILGLAIGAGFVEGALWATAFILLAELLFVKLEYRLLRASKECMFYVEYADRNTMESILGLFRQRDVRVLNMEITRAENVDNNNASAVFSIRLNKRINADQLVAGLNRVDGVLLVEEL